MSNDPVDPARSASIFRGVQPDPSDAADRRQVRDTTSGTGDFSGIPAGRGLAADPSRRRPACPSPGALAGANCAGAPAPRELARHETRAGHASWRTARSIVNRLFNRQFAASRGSIG
jgi:hypothetical protein